MRASHSARDHPTHAPDKGSPPTRRCPRLCAGRACTSTPVPRLSACESRTTGKPGGVRASPARTGLSPQSHSWTAPHYYPAHRLSECVGPSSFDLAGEAVRADRWHVGQKRQRSRATSARRVVAIAKVVRGGSGGDVGRSGGGSRFSGRFFSRFAQSFEGEELLGHNHESEVMVQPGPGPAFVVVEAKDSFALLVVALDTPAKASQRH